MSLPWVSGFLKEMSITAQLVTSRRLKKNIFRDDYVKTYYQDLLRFQELGFVASGVPYGFHDSTSNSRRLERATTLNISGGKAKKLFAPKPKHTDLFMAMEWSDGVMRTPALMFTSDDTFDPKGPRAKEVEEWCKAWDISAHQIIYEPGGKAYTSADKTHVGHFMGIYHEELKGRGMIHDAGNEYKKGKEYILADGASAHMVLTPVTHGEFSVMDNRIFAIAKRWWRLERDFYCGDDLSKQSLYLLYCIGYVSPEIIKAQFTRNLLLDEEKLSISAVEKMLSENTRLTHSNDKKRESYITTHERWLEEGKLKVLEPPSDELDGAYWK